MRTAAVFGLGVAVGRAVTGDWLPVGPVVVMALLVWLTGRDAGPGPMTFGAHHCGAAGLLPAPLWLLDPALLVAHARGQRLGVTWIGRQEVAGDTRPRELFVYRVPSRTR